MRIREYIVFLYRIFLVYLFYAIARGLFIYMNRGLMGDYNTSDLFYYGLAFDNCAIMYTNLLFILLSLLPLWINTHRKFQKVVFWSYFIPNTIAYATNFIDMAYYPFSKSRLTSASFAVIEHENNKMKIFSSFLGGYWYMFVGFFLLIALWVFLYKRVKNVEVPIAQKKSYFGWSAVFFLGFGTLIMMAIRGGGFTSDTRPINMLDASRHVNTAPQADAILNTPFCLIRSMGKNKGFKEYHFVDETYINENLKPIKQYNREVTTQPNVVLFILESFGKEYWGCMNTKTHIPDFKSYTPFLDSLSQHSYVLDNAYCTGRQSIHGMSSMLAGIPSFQVAYTSSPYVKQPTQSLVSIAKEMGYDTSFFHSAPNGSMGFLGFSNILGFDHYYGKNEYNNDADDDGNWGIWDEPFFQYMCRTYSEKKQPFLGTIFTLSSHHPFQIPKQYEGKFPKGNLEIHQCIGYTDYALKRFFEMAKQQKWYKNTIFVIVADHCASSAGSTELPLDGYRIPCFIVADFITPKRIDVMMSQIDVMPTVFGLLNFNYTSKFIGQDVLKEGYQPRAYIATYQDLGYLTPDKLTIISPLRKTTQYSLHKEAEQPSQEYPLFYEQVKENNLNKEQADACIGTYQATAEWLKNKQYNAVKK